MCDVEKKESGMHEEGWRANVKASAKLRRTYEEKMDRVQGCFGMKNDPDFIVIEDDNGDSEVENYDSEVPLRRSQSHYHSSSSSGHSGSKSLFDTYELSASSSDEEDCVLIEPHASVPAVFSKHKFSRAGKRPRPSADFKNESSRKRRSNPSDILDCEIVLDFDGTVKQNWEEAALRRRTGKARRADSEESTSASVRANTDGRKSRKGHDRIDLQFLVKRSWDHAFGTGPARHAKRRPEDVVLDQQDSNINVSDIGSDGIAEEASLPQNILKSVHVGVSGGDGEVSKKLDDINKCLKPSECVEANGTLAAAEKIVTDRETLKRTEEYLHADQEEWARRRLELQKQAEKVQRERKKRKLEVERRMEMEARQKRRLDEIRQSQLKEEQASGLKEQVRDRVQLELEHIATTCRDMATLLRRLGVPVDGGAFASDQQVTAAYKKALLRFHPDRAAALAKSDPASQVEAEEKFKLVSRMKSVLPLVSSNFFR
ncbi:hypothetical protein L7F22_065131 [Adiantum nelumboides]|nr:hypothetical protein [Adiantum nelumboides]